MDELQKLYNVLARDGYYTKSFDEFKIKFQSPEYQDKVFSTVSREGLFTKGKEDFLSKYAAPAIKKKEDSAFASVSEGTSLATPEMETQKPSEFFVKGKIKSPSTFNKNIDEADFSRHQELYRSAKKSIDGGDLQSFLQNKKKLDDLRKSYGDVMTKDPNLSEDYRLLNSLSEKKFKQGNKKDLRFIQEEERIPVKNTQKKQLEKAIKGYESDVKYTPEERVTMLEVQRDLLSSVDYDGIKKEVSDEYSAYSMKPIRTKIGMISVPQVKGKANEAIKQAVDELVSAGKEPNKDAVLRRASEIREGEIKNTREYQAIDDKYKFSSIVGKSDDQKEKEQTLLGIKKKREAHVEMFRSKVNELENYENQIKQYENIAKTQGQLSDDQKSEVLDLFNKYKRLSTDITKNYSNIENDIENIGDFDTELDAFKRNHTYLTSASVKALANLENIGAGISGGAGMLNSIAYDLTGNPEYYTRASDFLGIGKKVQDSTQGMLDGVSKSKQLEDINDAGDAIEWAGAMMVENTPQILINVLTNGQAIPFLAASAAGEKYMEVYGDENYSKLQKYAASILVGGGTAISEKLELAAFNKLWPSKRLAKAAIESSGREAFEKSLSAGVRKGISDVFSRSKKALAGVNQEGVSEVADQLSRNLVDKYVLDKEDVSITDGLGEAYLSGAVVGAGLGAAPHVFSSIVRPFVNDPNKDIIKNVDKIQKLSEYLATADEKMKPIIQERIDQLRGRNESIIQSAVNSFDNLSPSEIKEAVEIYEDITSLKKEYGDIKEDTTIPPDVKEALLESIFARYNGLVERRLQILDKAKQSPVKAKEVAEVTPQAEPEVVAEEGKEKVAAEEQIDLFKLDDTEYELGDDGKWYNAETLEEIDEETTGRVKSEAKPSKKIPKRGSKGTIAGVKVTYPTMQEARERKAARNEAKYVEDSSENLEEENTQALTEDLQGEFGILTAENPMAQPLTEEENTQLNQKAEEWLKEKGYKPRRVTGKYNQAENSFFVKGITKEDAIAFAKKFNQDSVAHSEGLVYQDGAMNPRAKSDDNFTFGEFTPESNFVSVIKTKDGLKTFKIGYDFDTKTAPTTAETGQQQTVAAEQGAPTTIEGTGLRENIKKAVAKVFEKFEVKSFKNAKEMSDYAKSKYGSATGDSDSARVFVNKDGQVEVLVNEELADDTALGHEVWHGLLLKAFGDNQKQFAAFRGAINKTLRENGYEDVADSLDEFSSQYTAEEEVPAEEYLAQLGGMLTSGAIDAKNLTKQQKTLLDQIKDIINDFAVKLTGQPVFLKDATADTILDFMSTMSDMMTKGEDISSFFEGANKATGVKTRAQIDPRLSELGVDVDKKEKLPQKITPANESKVLAQVDNLLNTYPKALTDNNQWKELMSRVFSYKGPNGEVMIPKFPTGLSRMSSSVSEVLKELSKVSEKQRDLASSGLEGTKEIGKLYKEGKMDETDTGLYFLWNIMSIGISPYPQEAGFLRAVNNGIDSFIKKSADGKFLTGKEIDYNGEKIDSGLAEYFKWVDETLPKGVAGSGSKANLRSFGSAFLSKASTKIESGEFSGLTKMQALHEILSDKTTPTNELRRKWLANLSGMSFNNKIFDFILLTTGRSDLFVIDRVRTEHFWDSDNLKKESGLKPATSIYDGSELIFGKTKGAGYSKMLSDVSGMVFAELANRTMQPVVQEAYSKIGVTNSPDVGRFHWETWVAASSQEVSHGSIDAIVQRKKSGEITDAGIRQGKYGAWDFNFAYKKRSGKDFVYEFVDEEGNTYVFDDISEIYEEISNQNTKKGYKDNLERFILKDEKGNIIKRKTEKIDNAWYDQYGVNKQKYFEYLKGKAKEFIPAPNVIEDQGVIIVKEPEVKTRAQKAQPQTIPGYDRMIEETKKIVEKSKKRGVSLQNILSNVTNYIQKSAVYEKADDLQREQIIRDARKDLGFKQKSSPSVDKLFGSIKDVKKVTVTEKSALSQMLKSEAAGARNAISARAKAAKVLNASLKALVSTGSVKVKQVSAIMTRYAKVDMFSSTSVNAFVDYMTKVFADAEYSEKLKASSKLSGQIKRLSKQKNVQAGTVEIAGKFLEIDPRLVDNIDEYLEYAEALKGAIAANSARVIDGDIVVTLKEAIDYEKFHSYMDDQIAKQEEYKINQLMSIHQDLVDAGVIDASMSLKDIKAIIDSIDSLDSETFPSEEKEIQIRTYLNTVMDSYRSIIDYMLDNSVDPFNFQFVDISGEARLIIEKFMKIDLSKLNIKEAYGVVDAINNFITNQNTDNMRAVLASYQGVTNAETMEKKGVRARRIRSFFSKSFGRVWAEQIEQLSITMQRAFGGVTIAKEMLRASGITDISIGKTKAQTRLNSLIKEYADKFSGTKDFNTSENVFERSMVAFMNRTINGSEIQQGIEFERRKKIILESIEAMERGSEEEQRNAKYARDVYDKVVSGSKSIDEVNERAEGSNVEAVEFWNKKFAEIFDDLQSLSRTVYNTILEKDMSYTPDVFKRIRGGDVNMEATGSSFASTGDYYDTQKAGTLMKNNRIKTLGENPSRILSFDFDSNMSNAMLSGLLDIETAFSIRQAKAFFESNSFKRMVQSAEDRELIAGKVKKFITDTKRKGYVQQSELTKMIKSAQFISSIATARALGSLAQVPKQTVSVAVNTLINAGRLDFADVVAAKDFIENSGYSIAIRGIASNADVQSLNKILEREADTSFEKVSRATKKVSDFWLENFIAKPDVWIARVSWISYYKQNLKKQGYDVSGIDWSTHKINKDAADYAQSQVDRQQNYSDSDLAGDLMNSKDPAKSYARKMLFPFMTFVFNQKSRMMADIAILSNKTATKEDKIISAKSLASLGAEMAAYSLVGFAIKEIYQMAVEAFTGADDDEEKKKRRLESSLKYSAKNAVVDLLSPVPNITDDLLVSGINNAMNAMGVDEKLNLPEDKGGTILEQLGVSNVLYSKFTELSRMTGAAISGEATGEYMGKEYSRTLSKEDREKSKIIASTYLAYYLGLLPADFGSVASKSYKELLKRSKKPSSSGGGDIDSSIKSEIK
jgi:hypothetical protein